MEASPTAEQTDIGFSPRSNLRRLASWTALILFAALTLYGFREAGLLHQQIWTPAGLNRFLIFTAAYWMCFGLATLLRPQIFPLFVLAAALAYTLAAIGPLAILSVLLVTLSSLILGQAILHRAAAFPDNSPTANILAALLGLSLYMFVLSIAALEPVNYPLVYLAALAAPLIWQWRRTSACLTRVLNLRNPRLSRTEQLASAALIFVLLLHWLVVLEPETGSDALSIHLVIPEYMRLAHRWHFDVTRHLQAVMPKGANWIYTLCFFLGGEFAARLFNLTTLLGIIALLVATIRRWLPLAPTLLLAGLFAATPLVQLVTGSLFVENLWAILGFGALIALSLYRDTERSPLLYLAFVLLGAAVASKSIALAFLPPFAVVIAWTLWTKRHSLPRLLRQTALASLCFLVFAIPPYWTAAAKTGNPVFPYFPAIFPSRFQSLAEAFGGPPPTGPRTLAAPFEMTFHTARYREVQDGAMGFQYFLFLPLAIVLVRRKWPDIARLSGLAFALFSIATLRADPTSRYFYAALPMATVLVAAALAELRALDPRLYRISLALAAAVLCVDLYFLPSSSWMFKDFVTNPASRQARLDYLTTHAPERNLVAYLNRAHPGAPVAFFESNAIAGLHAPALTTTWHNVEFYHRMLDAASPAECAHILRESGAHFVIAPLPSSGIPITTTPQEAFLTQCTVADSTSGNFYAGHVKDACPAAPDQPPAILSAGEYDDWDARLAYRGLWSRMRFPDASHATLTASSSAGAELNVRFDGSEIVYVYTKAFNRGIAEILLDGSSQGMLDLYSPSIEWRTATPFRATGRGPHTLQIRVTGRKNAAAAGVFADVDALIVR